MAATRRFGQAIILAFALLLTNTVLGQPTVASAAVDIGHRSIAYTGVSNPPTSDKPQSKLWWNDGSWWADMWVSGNGWHIFKLNRTTETWVDTGVLNDSRGSTLADTLWDGTHLYIASHVVTVSTDTTPVASVSGQPARLYRYSYAGGVYTPDSGFPTQIANNSSESMVIDEDSTGSIWATWTQVTGNATAGWTNSVWVNVSSVGGAVWQAPFIIPATNPHPSPDDISALVAYKNQIGVMWSDQLTSTVFWAVHTDGTSATESMSWKVRSALTGTGTADDHINIKTLQSDAAGRVYAAVKTSFNDTAGTASRPQLLLVTYTPGTGAPGTGVFTKSTISTVADCVSRPQVLLDSQNGLVHVFQTAPSTTVSGCAFSGVAGSIYEKTASMGNPVFATGRGTPVIEDSTSANLNNVTTTKQSVNSTTGLVVMASNDVTKRYWFADESLGTTVAAPVAAFTSTPTSGSAPLAVQFTDTSTNSPTSWAWNFGDGSTATTQSPAHTYAAPGTFTVTLTATNSIGSNTVTKTGLITVTAPASGVTIGASTTAFAATAANTVNLAKPTGVAAGDVLVASITADLNPAMSNVPTGWVPMVDALSVNSSASAGARVFAYYKVLTGTDPASYAWTLSSAQKWGGGITAYRGVNNTTPLDSSVVTAVNTSFSATTLTIPSITTVSNGAMLVGGVGLDSSTTNLTSPPTGWKQEWQAGGGQIAAQADILQPAAGASGTATWTLSAGRALSGWRTALKPAG